MVNVKVLGMGRYLPENKIESSYLDTKFGYEPGTFAQKSGLISRHFAQAHETSSYMGTKAALDAVKNAGIELHDIDLIVGACGVGEQWLPSTSVLIQKHLGLGESGVACFDINSTCLSFLTALDTVSYLLDAGRYKRALIVSSDMPSIGLNWDDMETCSIFGDGAAACVVEKSDGSSRILSSHMETHSIGSSFCKVEAGGTRFPPAKPLDHQHLGLFYMDGKKVFKLASQLLTNTLDIVFEEAGVTLNDISWVIPHQASLLAMHHIRKRLDIPEEKFVNIFATHGNQVAASIPSAFCYLVQSKKVKRGDLILFLGTGAGVSCAGLIMEY